MKRECEERMELIDALGEAREQLLILKKPAGSVRKVQCSGDKVNVAVIQCKSFKAVLTSYSYTQNQSHLKINHSSQFRLQIRQS